MKKQVNNESAVVNVDFTKVMVETEYERFEECDLRKVVGNTIHKGCSDLDMDEIGRAINRDGVADIPADRIEEVRSIFAGAALVYAYKMAIIGVLTPQK